jgi:hypothetical protein
MANIHESFDRFHFDIDISILPLATLLTLPLTTMFSEIPANHWLLRQTQMSASTFFIYDPQTRRLRLKVAHEYQEKPRLCKQLYNDILQRRVIRLAPHLWRFITDDHNLTSTEHPDALITQQITKADGWTHYNSRWFRLSSYYTPIDYAPKMISLLWKTPMLLQARSLWYRILIRKLPTRYALSSIRIIDSPNCLLCENAFEENQYHFLVGCPHRWKIWRLALRHCYPDLLFVPMDIYMSLCLSTTPPDIILNRSRYLTIISTIQWCIWRAYWDWVFNDVPIHTHATTSKITTHLSILLKH